MRRVACAGLLALGLLAAQGTAVAQRSVNDPFVFEPLGSALIEKASPWLLRATRISTPIALEITFPEGATGPQWQSLHEFLMRSLHGRPPRDGDTVRQVLSLSAEVASDSLRAWVDLGFRTLCHGAWINDGTGYTMSWSNGGGYWRYPKREQAFAYDSFGGRVEP